MIMQLKERALSGQIAMRTAPAASAASYRVQAARVIADFHRKATDRNGFIVGMSLLMVDETILMGSLFSAFFVRNWVIPFTRTSIPSQQLPCLALEMALIPLCFYLMHFYPGYGMAPVERLRRRILATIFSFVALLIWDYLGAGGRSSRGTILLTASFAIPTGVLLEAAAIRLLARLRLWGTPVILVGKADRCKHIIKMLRRQPEIGYIPAAACVTDPGLWGKYLEQVTVIGPCESAKLLARHIPTCIIVSDGQNNPLEDRRSLRSTFKYVIWIPSHLGLASLHTQSRDLGGVLGVELKNNLRTRHLHRIKRIGDLAIAIPALILSLPIIAGYSLFILLLDRGPVTFRHTRVGFGGRQFQVLKLRTMYADATERLSCLLDRDPNAKAHWEKHFKLPKDPRILPYLGRIVRKYSLDELPQLWNVVRGEMSLVGPRPFPVYHLEAFSSQFRSLRRGVRPGLTGFWQVSARSDGDLETQEMMDSYYIRNWSLWLDLYILVRTMGVVLNGRGAY